MPMTRFKTLEECSTPHEALADLLSPFIGDTAVTPRCEEVTAEQLPAPFHWLLVHRNQGSHQGDSIGLLPAQPQLHALPSWALNPENATWFDFHVDAGDTEAVADGRQLDACAGELGRRVVVASLLR